MCQRNRGAEADPSQRLAERCPAPRSRLAVLRRVGGAGREAEATSERSGAEVAGGGLGAVAAQLFGLAACWLPVGRCLLSSGAVLRLCEVLWGCRAAPGGGPGPVTARCAALGTAAGSGGSDPAGVWGELGRVRGSLGSRAVRNGRVGWAGGRLRLHRALWSGPVSVRRCLLYDRASFAGGLSSVPSFNQQRSPFWEGFCPVSPAGGIAVTVSSPVSAGLTGQPGAPVAAPSLGCTGEPAGRGCCRLLEIWSCGQAVVVGVCCAPSFHVPFRDPQLSVRGLSQGFCTATVLSMPV